MSSNTGSLHVSFDRQPLLSPKADAPHVLIVGGGIIGLSSAWTLLDSGYKVTILAHQFGSTTQRITSQIAGALWEYPPATCGRHSSTTLLEASKRWSMVSYHVYKQMAADPALSKLFGVQMRDAVFFSPVPVKEDKDSLFKMREIQRSGVAGFRHDSALISELGVDESTWKDAYELSSPVIDTDVALPYIMELVQAKGARFINRTISGDLLNDEHALLEEFSAHVIVNASGLGAASLAKDPKVFPLRGAVHRVVNDGSKFKKLDKALITTATKEGLIKAEFIFIVPRNDRILYVGGFSEPNVTDPVTQDIEHLKDVAQDAVKFIPGIDVTHTDDDYPFAWGLRPARIGGVRLERELRPPVVATPGSPYSRIVHCYGHAGAGWSQAFGCALEVKTLVEEALDQAEPIPMQEESANDPVAETIPLENGESLAKSTQVNHAIPHYPIRDHQPEAIRVF
jgi:D-amino-acid oxidase